MVLGALLRRGGVTAACAVVGGGCLWRGLGSAIHSEARLGGGVPASASYDVAVVGGGIVGVATARQLLLSHPNLRVAVLEKESELACHQTGHNSGVIHAGIYYAPGSLMAKLCVKGNRQMYEFCDAHTIPYNRCGKLVVAVTEEEVPRLRDLYARAQQNGVPGLSWVEADAIASHEPHCSGLAAVHCTSTGIVDYKVVTEAMAKEFEGRGGHVKLEHHVTKFEPADEAEGFASGIIVRSDSQPPIRCHRVITCGGLYSDRLAVAAGGSELPKIIPVRGEYLILKKGKEHLAQGNIYPVPTPGLPFLGFHFTPRVNGDVWLGPNAIVAFSREGYTYGDVNLSELGETVTYPGFWRLALANVYFGIREISRSLFYGQQVKQLRRYVPELTVDDVERGPAGVRAMALDREGNMVKDFVFEDQDGCLLHVRNAPSPAATSSIAIAEMVVDKASDDLGLHALAKAQASSSTGSSWW